MYLRFLLISWQVISPVEVVGYVVVVDELLTVQNKTYDRPTIIVAKRVRGEEEIPDGAVAVLTPDMPDVLSHVSVRARNGKVKKKCHHVVTKLLLMLVVLFIQLCLDSTCRSALPHVLILGSYLISKQWMGKC